MRADSSPSTAKQAWSVYLLVSGSGRTYIGSTTDVRRRARQHNRELVGGARATAREAPTWILARCLHGFTSRSEACRWERILKCRARGFERRMMAFAQVALGVCPSKGRLPAYSVPKGLFIIYGQSIGGS